MMKPWNIKTDDSRKEDSKRTFFIFCEDEAVEPTYFETFKRDDIHINIFGGKKQHHAQVDTVAEHFRKENSLAVIENNGIVQEILNLDEGVQVWCVFDRDKDQDDKKDTAFNDSIYTANTKGIQTAWSNDNFELWILLHFEDVDNTNPEYTNRKKYYERLTEILQSHYPDETKFTNPKFDYFTSMKSKKDFIRYTHTLMKEHVGVAIERAEKLDNAFKQNPPIPPHLQSPCTKVYVLVKELMK